MSAADKFTPGVRSALRRCKRDGAVLRRELAGKAPDLVNLGLAEGEDGMIALTEVGKIVWTLLDEIHKLDETIDRMRKKRIESLDELRTKIIRGPAEPERKPRSADPNSSARSAVAFRDRDMTCGSTNTDTFRAFLATLPADPFAHRPRNS